jgi:hypothetical protein
MKKLLLLLSVIALVACDQGSESTEVKTDSTAIAVDSTLVDTTKVLVDSVK